MDESGTSTAVGGANESEKRKKRGPVGKLFFKARLIFELN